MKAILFVDDHEVLARLSCEILEMQGYRAVCAYNAADAASRLAGGDISHRPSVLGRRAIISMAPPLDLTERFDEYARDKRRAMDAAFSDLQERYTDSIKERIDERRDREKARGDR